ncbi:MAG: hypothetical protein V4632_01665 [Pseudomonadota bacterium]
MNRSSSSFSPLQQGARAPRNKTRTAQGAADFLRGHEKMASLLPTVSRMMALQKDCAAVLPDMFSACGVLQFESEQLVLSIPNAALAARLKQVLPKLQDTLLKRGWQVNAIRLKVQVGKNVIKATPIKQLTFPDQAISALSNLGTTLEETPRNAALRAAISALVQRHRNTI